LTCRFDVDDFLAGGHWRCGVGETDFADVLVGVVGLARYEERGVRGSGGGGQGSESEGVFHDYGCSCMLLNDRCRVVATRKKSKNEIAKTHATHRCTYTLPPTRHI